MQQLPKSQFSIFDFAERFAITTFGIGTVAAVFVSMALIFVGLFEIVTELVFYLRDAPNFLDPNQPYPELGPGKAVIVAGIHLVELFLLAPLPYLVARTTALFFQESHFRGKEDAHAFHTVKLLIATLLIGLIAASIAADSIEGDLQPLRTLAATSAMLVLVVYFLGMQFLSRPRADETASDTKSQDEQLDANT